MKRIISFLLAIAVVFSLTGCQLKESTKVYYSKGFQITLPDDFESGANVIADYVNHDYALTSPSAKLTAFKEALSDYDYCSIEEYAEYLYQANTSLNLSKFSKNGSLLYSEYTDTQNGEQVSHIIGVFKGSKNFWVVEFMCPQKRYDSMKPKFFEWFKTVEVV